MDYDEDRKYIHGGLEPLAFAAEGSRYYSEVPNSVFAAKHEMTDYWEDENTFDTFARGEMKNFTPEQPAYEADKKPLTNIGEEMGLLSSRFYGGRTKARPDRPEMHFGNLDKDPRDTTGLPNFRGMVQATKDRHRFVTKGPDAPTNVPESHRTGVREIMDNREADQIMFNRIKPFREKVVDPFLNTMTNKRAKPSMNITTDQRGERTYVMSTRKIRNPERHKRSNDDFLRGAMEQDMKVQKYGVSRRPRSVYARRTRPTADQSEELAEQKLSTLRKESAKVMRRIDQNVRGEESGRDSMENEKIRRRNTQKKLNAIIENYKQDENRADSTLGRNFKTPNYKTKINHKEDFHGEEREAIQFNAGVIRGGIKSKKDLSKLRTNIRGEENATDQTYSALRKSGTKKLPSGSARVNGAVAEKMGDSMKVVQYRSRKGNKPVEHGDVDISEANIHDPKNASFRATKRVNREKLLNGGRNRLHEQGFHSTLVDGRSRGKMVRKDIRDRTESDDNRQIEF